MSAPTISPPIFIAGTRKCSVLLDGGELKTTSLSDGKKLLSELQNPILIYTSNTFHELGLSTTGLKTFQRRDLLELFLLVRPGQSVTPTLYALCKAVGISPPSQQDEGFEAEKALKVSQLLLAELEEQLKKPNSDFLHALLHLLNDSHWGWMEDISFYYPEWKDFKFSHPKTNKKSPSPASENIHYSAWLEVWYQFDKWEAEPLRPDPGHKPVAFKDALERLGEIKSKVSEERPTQQEFSLAASKSFAPRKDVGKPNVVYAQGGTGIGKTLAYLAPSSVWSEQNQGAVWLSTYTKHLQQQLWDEAQSLSKLKNKPKIVLKKGRENYLCLLSLQEVLQPVINGASTQPGYATIPFAFLLNWAKQTKDGDLFDGSLSGWFSELLPFSLSNIADRSGECLYASCPFYQTCFVEKVNRRARQADIVISNHALTILSANQEASLISSSIPDATVSHSMPRHFVFDEGHLLFEACDNAFLTEFSISSWTDMRRWLLGQSNSRRRRLQGLRRRLEEIILLRPEIGELVREVEHLTSSIFRDFKTTTALEVFFKTLRTHLNINTQHDENRPSSYEQECELFPIHPDLEKTIPPLISEFQNFVIKAKALHRELSLLPEDEAFKQVAAPEYINKAVLLAHSLKTRVINLVSEWIHILEEATAEPEYADPSLQQINIVRSIQRPRFGRHYKGQQDEVNIGIFRHYLDPMKPFAESMKPIAHGILETSATLFPPPSKENDLVNGTINLTPAELLKLGTAHLTDEPELYSFESPFDYENQCKVFIVQGINKATLSQAYEALFSASGGGALGLFTAISRLKKVYADIHKNLSQQGIPLLSQHVGEIGNATLAQIFRDDLNSCLLGTDAMRDGLDIPGNSLRMIVLEKVPWARPDILHKKRKQYFNPKAPSLYDEDYARARIRQAFGRLIRRASDRGVFVLLDSKTPSKLLNAFPKEVEVVKAPLQECVEGIIEFLHTDTFKEASLKGSTSLHKEVSTNE